MENFVCGKICGPHSSSSGLGATAASHEEAARDRWLAPEQRRGGTAVPRGISVTFVIQWLRSGGAEKQVLLLAKHLALVGLRCRILTLASCKAHERTERLVSEARRAGVVIERPELIFPKGAQFLYTWARLARVREGVIWTWGTRADLAGKLAVVFKPRIRLVCALRSANRERILRDARWMRFLNGRVNAYIANSHYNCELLELAVPGAASRCRVCYNALSDEELAESEVELPATLDRLRVVMLGNIRLRLKGYDTLLRLAKQLVEESAPVEFHIAGRGDEAEFFLAERARLGLQSVVLYHGETSRPVEFLRTGHAFLLASRVEGMPNALLEAMNLGLPCLSTRVGDVARFAQDGVHLRLVESEDVDGMARVLKDFRNNWAQARRLGMAGRDLCRRKFAPARIAQQTLDALCEIDSPS